MVGQLHCTYNAQVLECADTYQHTPGLAYYAIEFTSIRYILRPWIVYCLVHYSMDNFKSSDGLLRFITREEVPLHAVYKGCFGI